VRQVEVEIIGNREVAPGWRELSLSWTAEAGRPLPGQFFTLRVSARYDPLLRRPFAFSGSSLDGGRVEALYQVRGPATEGLASLAPGARLDALGPLGSGFPVPRPGERSLLAGGGIGLGPVLYLARELAREAALPFAAVFGFRTAASIPRLDFPAGSTLATDDGSAGFHGTAGDWLTSLPAGAATRLYACGPGPMLAALAALARERDWEASLSAEQWMACGVGACMGCAVRRADGQGYLRACADGPVFGRDEIDWSAP
jgi:dihydroorotate dehydrogenase electron transfer subunit